MPTSNTETLAHVPTFTATPAARIALWVSTGLFCGAFALSGAMFLIGPPDVVTKFRHLGYPDYFRQLLGVAKLLGVAALVLRPPSPILREWAYAGFTFTCVGAAVSHVMSGDAVGKAVAPLVALALLVTSYLLRRRVRAA
ncbi:MAG TPA: DoxX family protein [Polyangiaceae bacterium]|nr:DoxX family protein [Polyangiaceae bacterium]